MSFKNTSSILLTAGFMCGLYVGYTMSDPAQISPNSAQVCFTPEENCTALIEQRIDNAKTSIFVQSYSFTSIPIAQALLRAHNRGVQVKIILDKSNKDKQIPALEIIQRIPNAITIDILPGIAHNKIMIIDDIVLTGSFNFTKAAQFRNAENVLIIKNEILRNQYYNNWKHRYSKSFSL